MTTASVIRASASPSFSFSPTAYLSLPVPLSRVTLSTSSLSSAYEDGRDRFNWQADVDEAYLPANYHGTERRHADASDLCQDWWPYPNPTFPNMDLLQASELLPHTLDAHHQFSFVQNRTSIVSFHHGTLPHVSNFDRPCAHPTFNHWRQLQQFPPCAVAAPAGGAMSTQADASDAQNTVMGAFSTNVALQSESHTWHASLGALSPEVPPQCNVQTSDNERAAKRRRKQSNPTTFVCSECPGKSKSTACSLSMLQPVLTPLFFFSLDAAIQPECAYPHRPQGREAPCMPRPGVYKTIQPKARHAKAFPVAPHEHGFAPPPGFHGLDYDAPRYVYLPNTHALTPAVSYIDKSIHGKHRRISGPRKDFKIVKQTITVIQSFVPVQRDF